MTGGRHRRGRLWLLAATLLLGSCGLSEDSDPQAIAPENLPPDLLDPNPGSSTTLPQSAATTSITVYFLEQAGDTERLAEVEREVADPSQPGQRLTALLTRPVEQEEGLTTSIPSETDLLETSLNQEDNELVVDLSDELFSIQGEELAKAFAQIVYTVTEIDSIRRVRFLVDGARIQALDAEGVGRDTLTRADYAGLAPVP